MLNKEVLKELGEIIISAYESSVTLDDAERLAARFLRAQMQVAEELQTLDLDARMRKSGVKAIRAAVYAAACAAGEKKPTESSLDHTLNSSPEVIGAQDAFDTIETKRDEMERYFGIFKDAHVYFRQISKGRFE